MGNHRQFGENQDVSERPRCVVSSQPAGQGQRSPVYRFSGRTVEMAWSDDVRLPWAKRGLWNGRVARTADGSPGGPGTPAAHADAGLRRREIYLRRRKP